MIAPLAAIGLMVWFADDIRAVFWIAAIPAAARRSCSPGWRSRSTRRARPRRARRRSSPASARLDRADAAAARGRLPVHARALFGRLPDPEGIDVGLSRDLSPLTLVVFNLGFLALAYPAGALSDRISPRTILMAGMAVLIAADLILAQPLGIAGLVVGVPAVGRAHGADPGHFRADDRRQRARRICARPASAPSSSSAASPRCWRASARGCCGTATGPSATFLAGAGVAAVAMAMLSLLPEERAAPSG